VFAASRRFADSVTVSVSIIAALSGASVLAWLGRAPPALARAAVASAPAPVEVISPLPGTPDANPRTQISFLGAPVSALRDIVVLGSASGRHDGRLLSYSTGTGGSFLPDQPFDPGERVTVSAKLVGYGAPERLGTTFSVSTPVSLSQAPKAQIPAAATNVMHFVSEPDLGPPAVTVTTPDSDPAAGDVFVAPYYGPGQHGPMIVAPNGQLVWFKPLPLHVEAFDFNLQSYLGQPVLTWWQGHLVFGHGQGVDEIYSTNYTPIATLHGGNGLYADLHDFELTPQGTAWITAYAPQRRDLSALGGSRDGILVGCAVQEIDVKTGLVMFEWDAVGHVPIRYSYASAVIGRAYDWFHLNAIEPLSNGTFLISSRNTWAVYLISQQTGRVLWRLGGKRSTFTLGPGLQFAWQHDPQFLANGTLALFNNDDNPPEASQSSALVISLDYATDTATLVSRLTHPGWPILSDSQGDVQPLASGDFFVGWGRIGDASELSPSGQDVFDLHLAAPTNSYRDFRYPWSAQPAWRPSIAAVAAGAQTQISASWNGATDVASWEVLAGPSSSSLSPVGSYPDTGFETSILAPTTGPYVGVEALSETGAVLAASPVIVPTATVSAARAKRRR
jgi:hypothetical protein